MVLVTVSTASRKDVILIVHRRTYNTSVGMNVALRRMYSSGAINLSRAMSKEAKGPVEETIYRKLMAGLEPVHVELRNESYMHNVPKGSETHFKVVVVSAQFEGKPLIQRHRAVNTLLAEELRGGVHALSIVAQTPKQWETSSKDVDPSPKCRGGFGK